MLYQESDLDVIVGGERTVAEGLGAHWMAGQGIRATRRAQVDEVWNHPEEVALPFPFTLKEFAAFCVWHPTFAWEAIQGPFTNDDNTLDEIALSELAERGSDAAKLVRYALNGFVEPSRQETRPADARLVNIDRLAQEIARAMGFTKAEFALKALSLTNAIVERCNKGEFQLYCEDGPYPFDLGELEAVHGGLRLMDRDADKLRRFYLGHMQDKDEAQKPVVTTEEKDSTHAATYLPGLSTSDIAHCFAGLYWATDEKWKKPLGDKPKWLAACITMPGQRGGIETQWDPVRLGAALARDKGIKVKTVRARFQTNHLLKPYLSAWKVYEDEYFPEE